MAWSVKVEVLSGAMDDSALCYLLQVEDLHLLLDCGLDSIYDEHYLSRLKVLAPKINAVLITHANQQHLGALPYLVSKCGLSCPIYATVPVYHMGQMFMYDWHESLKHMGDYMIFTLDDVDTAFEKIYQLKYSETVTIGSGQSNALQAQPLLAGHTLGGTVWRICSATGEQIIYAVDFNHKTERVLNGCSFESIYRPNLLITDAYNFNAQENLVRLTDEALISNVLHTLRNHANCLIVADTAGRVLELMQLLEQLWQKSQNTLKAYAVLFMNYMAFNITEYAKCHLEWMSDSLLRNFMQGVAGNPFQFKHLRVCHSMAELESIRKPKVVLASQADMESGFSREIFLQWCQKPENSVIIVNRSKQGTLASRLIQMATTATFASSHELTIEIKRRVFLEGDELDAYVIEKKRKRQMEMRARLEAQRRISHAELKEVAEGMESEEQEADSYSEPTGLETTSSEFPYDVMFSWVSRVKSDHGVGKKPPQPFFRYVERKIKWDEYGELIDANLYAPVESRQLVSDSMNHREADNAEEVFAADNVLDEPPMKTISSEQTVNVACRLEFIEFEGRVDSESMKKILQLCKPKEIVIVHGLPNDTALMSQHCRRVLGMPAEKIHTPQIGDTVTATAERFVYKARIDNSLMASLKFVKINNIEVAWIDAEAAISASQITTDAEEMDEEGLDSSGEVKSAQPISDDMLLKKPSEESNTIRSAVFVGDIKLSRLKKALIKNGLNAEFFDETLAVENVISIRKESAKKVVIEGVQGEKFYAARDAIYEEFAIL